MSSRSANPQVAVVTTFGKPTRPITKPGAYLKWPWPIQKVWWFDRRVQNFEDRLTEGLTRGQFQPADLGLCGLADHGPRGLLPAVRRQRRTRSRRRKRCWTNGWAPPRRRSWAGIRSADFLSTTDNGASFVAIENEILATIQSQLRTNNFGLKIEFLGIKRLQLPESVSQQVFERMTSERKVLADRFQYEGEAEAQRIRSTAERRAAELLANAQGQATEIKGQGEAEAAKSLKVFQQNPELASFIFRLSALEDSLKDRSTLIFDQHTPPFDLFQGVSTNLSPPTRRQRGSEQFDQSGDQVRCP